MLWRNNKYNYDPSIDFKDLDEISNDALENWWRTGGWYQLGNCQIKADFGQGQQERYAKTGGWR